MLWNSVRLALRSIRRNLLRSFLTVLGIVIGVSAVITMVTLGNGATSQVTNDIASLGSRVLIVNPGQGMGPGSRAAAPFDLADALAIEQEISGLKAVAPIVSGGAMVVYGNKNWLSGAIGVDDAFRTVRNWDLDSGRDFTASELRAGRPVCILGETVRDQLFGSLDPLGAKVRINTISFQVVGVLEAKGQSAMGSDQDDVVLIPLRTFQRRISGDDDVQLVQVSVQDDADVAVVQASIE
ncbi:MAG: ABC transporter permease, partial [Planctomycetota bacterium]